MTMRDGFMPRSADARPPVLCRRTIAALLCAAAVVTAACSSTQADAPQAVAIGEDIAVGPYAFRLLRSTPTPNPPPPISTFRPQPGKRGIAVFVSWKTLDARMDDLRRIAFVEKFLEAQLSLVDADGTDIRPTSAMQQRLMFMQDPGPNWRDWVVVFHVPAASNNLSVLVRNPEPREGQARTTITRLQP